MNKSGLSTLKVGLTGGIGSGKTTVAHIFRQMGFPVYIADREAARLMHSNGRIRRQLIELFGTEIYTPTGELDRKGFANLIFNNPEALAAVNAVVHPEVMNDFMNWCEQQTAPFAIFESAILFEAGLDRVFDYIICVTAPMNTRIKRVMVRDKVSEEKVRERMKNQEADEIKCKKSDFIISTEEGKMVLPQIESNLEHIRQIIENNSIL